MITWTELLLTWVIFMNTYVPTNNKINNIEILSWCNIKKIEKKISIKKIDLLCEVKIKIKWNILNYIDWYFNFVYNNILFNCKLNNIKCIYNSLWKITNNYLKYYNF